jgi:formylglycine-generating enzyme required for sulfatase activity
VVEGPPGGLAEELFARHLEALERGEASSLELLCVQEPAAAEELRRLALLYERLAPLVDEALGAELGAEQTVVLPSFGPGAGAEQRYLLGPELGRGGMGVVFRATDLQLGREVALKVARGGSGPQAERRRRRFLREARIAVQLAHPHILAVFELHEDEGGSAAYTMPVVEGLAFDTALAAAHGRSGEWTVARCLGVLARVCDAMAYAHERGVVHRDLKPANVLVGRFGEVYVADWGLARRREETEEGEGAEQAEEADGIPAPGAAGLTAEGDVFGTPAYMAPEQAAGQTSRIGPLADVYAVGAMLYHLLAGRAPHVGADGGAVLAELRRGPPLPLGRVAPRAPAELVAIAERALQREPEQRYSSMAELRDDLRAFLEGRVVRAYESGALAELRKWIGRHRGLAVGAGLALVTALAGALAVGWQDRAALREERLSTDALRLRDLRERAEQLWPAVPAVLPDLRQWQREAEVLMARRGEHQARRDRSQGERRVQADEYLAALERLSAQGGAWTSVGERIELAANLERRSIDEPRAAWIAAAGRVAADARFAGFELAPQLGLVPLGPDPESGLEEFAHLASGVPVERDGEGVLLLRPECGVVLVLVPGGEFAMGVEPPGPGRPLGADNVDPRSEDFERPVHSVPLAPYVLGKFELTRAQWLRAAEEDPSLYADPEVERLGLHPVTGVTWNAASSWLFRRDLVLPTEAQWERAARGVGRGWWSPPAGEGDELLARHAAELRAAENLGLSGPAPVGTHRANPFGLHDLLGNVCEWCQDRWGPYTLPTASDTGERLAQGTEMRVYRGGAYALPADWVRASHRLRDGPEFRTAITGVRPAYRLRR